MEDFFELFFHFFPSAGATIGRPAPVDKGGCSHDMRHHATRARALNTCWLWSHTSQTLNKTKDEQSTYLLW